MWAYFVWPFQTLAGLVDRPMRDFYNWLSAKERRVYLWYIFGFSVTTAAIHVASWMTVAVAVFPDGCPELKTMHIPPFIRIPLWPFVWFFYWIFRLAWPARFLFPYVIPFGVVLAYWYVTRLQDGYKTELAEKEKRIQDADVQLLAVAANRDNLKDKLRNATLEVEHYRTKVPEQSQQVLSDHLPAGQVLAIRNGMDERDGETHTTHGFVGTMHNAAVNSAMETNIGFGGGGLLSGSVPVPNPGWAHEDTFMSPIGGVRSRNGWVDPDTGAYIQEDPNLGKRQADPTQEELGSTSDATELRRSSRSKRTRT